LEVCVVEATIVDIGRVLFVVALELHSRALRR